jgi:pyridoxamine 5'-phosphate oxidase
LSERAETLPARLPADPMPVVAGWLAHAAAEGVQPNPDAMVLATADGAGRPSARVVLCKRCVPDPGYLVFFTNYGSRKGRELDARGDAAAVIHWDALARQIRVEGIAVRAPADESDRYFAARAVPSRVGAWASRQSQPLARRAELESATREAAARFGVRWPFEGRLPEPDEPIPRPPFWGGYRLWARSVELWVEGAGRLHDRAAWTRRLEPAGQGFRTGDWRATRLQP